MAINPQVRRLASSWVVSLLLTPSVTRAADAESLATAPPALPDPPPERRSGLVVATAIGFGLAGASGYPNNATRIGSPEYYSSSDLLAGVTASIFVMGALTDYLNFGFWLGAGTAKSSDWRSTSFGVGFRIEVFPFYRLYPVLRDLGAATQLGVGSATPTSTLPGSRPSSSGSQSFVGAGLFYELSLFKMLGGHVAGGPSVDYYGVLDRTAWRRARRPLRVLRRQVTRMNATRSRDGAKTAARVLGVALVTMRLVSSTAALAQAAQAAPIVSKPADAAQAPSKIERPRLKGDSGAAYPDAALAERYFQPTSVSVILEIDPAGAVTKVAVESPRDTDSMKPPSPQRKSSFSIPLRGMAYRSSRASVGSTSSRRHPRASSDVSRGKPPTHLSWAHTWSCVGRTAPITLRSRPPTERGGSRTCLLARFTWK